MRPLTNLASQLFALLQTGLNRYLALDPETPRRLRALHGKIIVVELMPLAFNFQLKISAEQIHLTQPEQDVTPDTIIKGTPLGLARLTLAAPSSRQKFFADAISMQGNLALGQQIIEIFDHLEIDWEEYTARLIGDLPAHHLGVFTHAAKQWLSQTRAALWQNSNEYCHEEINLLPTAEALQDFFQDIDAARMATDRLSARLANLQLLLASQNSLATEKKPRLRDEAG